MRHHTGLICLVLFSLMLFLFLFGVGRPEQKATQTVPKSVRNIEKTRKQDRPKKPPAALTVRRLKLTRVQLQGIDNGLLFYFLDKEEYPAGKGTYILEALTKPNDLNKDEIFDDPWLPNHKDPWGNPYNYEWPTKKFQNAKKPAVWSNGPNGKNENGRGDDVGNWQRENKEEGRRQKEEGGKKKKKKKTRREKSGKRE